MKGWKLLFWTLLVATLNAIAVDYPSRPIRMVVPFGVGTNTDILARIISIRLAERLGQGVVVDNRPGAGGNLGSGMVAKAAPDGYTIMFGAASVLAINPSLYASMPYDAATAFAPITHLVSVSNVLVVDPALSFNNISELITYAKRNPGKLNFASAGAGGSVHLSGELFKVMTTTDLVHVVYRSSPAAHIDIMGGRVQMMFDGLPSVLPQINAGKLRALAVTSATRSQLLRDVPTVAEAGIPGYEVVGWYGFVAPAGTPKPIVDSLYREIVRILGRPDVKETLLKAGAEPVGNSPEEFAAFIKSETTRWNKVIKDAGIELN